MFGLVQDIDGRYPLTPIRFVFNICGVCAVNIFRGEDV